ncbi:hypothetical protein [Lysinibacillus macroides]|uniref:Uncharacterized protein n=1 Tax=Lysinibacillus macroides TaxID=33935 RepID=A0A0N0UW75_9BACI|nr:hypothetical protein [Lysinibacillus macroides]KOY80677.1 hypothetical protein ADM90_15920 [Lysinibacillus macroides]
MGAIYVINPKDISGIEVAYEATGVSTVHLKIVSDWERLVEFSLNFDYLIVKLLIDKPNGIVEKCYKVLKKAYS